MNQLNINFSFDFVSTKPYAYFDGLAIEDYLWPLEVESLTKVCLEHPEFFEVTKSCGNTLISIKPGAVWHYDNEHKNVFLRDFPQINFHWNCKTCEIIQAILG